MAECDARKVSNYFQALEQGAIKLLCQEQEHKQQDNGLNGRVLTMKNQSYTYPKLTAPTFKDHIPD